MESRKTIAGALLAVATGLLVTGIAGAAPVLDQTGNRLANGSFEAGTTNPITGNGGIPSAAFTWRQWENGGNGAPTTELISEAEMQAEFGLNLVDGDHAVRVTTYGDSDGLFTFNSYGHPGWNLYDAVTFSGWVYVISGSMQFAVGSNQDGFTSTAAQASASWQFVSVTSAAGQRNDEPLLYSLDGPSEFIVDSVWLNNGTSSTHPMQAVAATSVPEPHGLLLTAAGLLLLGGARRRAPGAVALGF